MKKEEKKKVVPKRGRPLPPPVPGKGSNNMVPLTPGYKKGGVVKKKSCS